MSPPAACMPHWPRDDTVAVLTNSGGMGVQIADFVGDGRVGPRRDFLPRRRRAIRRITAAGFGRKPDRRHGTMAE